MVETVSVPVDESVLNRIRYHPAGYKPVEARIAEAILADPEAFIRESIVMFAQRIAVSTGSVVRFAQGFGFSGYSGLKMAIAQEVPRKGSELAAARSPFEQRMDIQIRALRAAAANIDASEVSRAARMIAGARHVELVATGSSASIANGMAFSLNVNGVYARQVADSSEHAAFAALLESQDVLVAISFSGRTRGTVDAAVRAQDSGAAVISLTCTAASPLLRHTDVAIVLDQAVAGLDEGEWPLRTGLYAAARALTLEVLDHVRPADLRKSRAKWSSGRHGIRYEARQGGS